MSAKKTTPTKKMKELIMPLFVEMFNTGAVSVYIQRDGMNCDVLAEYAEKKPRKKLTVENVKGTK